MHSGDINTDNTIGYQSAAYNDDMHNINIGSDEENEPRGYNPNQEKTAFGNNLHNMQSTNRASHYSPNNQNMMGTSLEELLPESMQHFAFLDVFIPKISRYVGTNLLQFFYLIAFVAGVFVAIINVFGLIINSFRVHWTLGLLSFIYSTVIGLGMFLLYIVALRLLVEFLMSVFVIRERLTRMVALKENM